MNKLLKKGLLLMSLFITLALNAQVKIGVRGGVYVPNLFDTDVSVEPGTGFHMGASLDVPMYKTKFLSFQTGFVFVKKEFNMSSTSTINPKYLLIPGHLAYKLSVAQNIRLFVHTGPNFLFGIGEEEYTVAIHKVGYTSNGNMTRPTQREETRNFFDDGNGRLHIGGGVGIGLEVSYFVLDISCNHEKSFSSNKYFSLYISAGFQF